jgi:hypothetical protein
MKSFLFLCSGLLCVFSINAQAPSFQWVKQAGGSQSSDYGLGIVADASGNVYYTGSAADVADMDPGSGTYTINGSAGNGFLSKLDAAGNFIWSKNIAENASNTTISYGQALALDTLGNIYLTGTFSGTVDLDPGPGTATFACANYFDDFFISKFDPAGNLLWTRVVGGSGIEYVTSIAVDLLGNCHVTGSFASTVDFDPGVGNFNLNAVNNDIFVLKLNASGNFIWAKQMQSTTTNGSMCIKTDTQGNVYTTGWFRSTVDFDPGPGSYPLTAIGYNDAYVLKLDVSGNLVWARQFGSSVNIGDNTGFALSVDAAGNVFATGYFFSTTDFDPGPGIYLLSPVGTYDTYVLKLNAAGNFVWAKNLGGNAMVIPWTLELDVTTDMYIGGFFQDIVDFDPGVGTFTLSTASNFTATNSNGFICKLDSAGNFIWAGSFGGSDTTNTSVASLFVDAAGSIYTTGWFEKTVVDFDPAPATTFTLSSPEGDSYAHKMNQCLVPPPPVNTTPPGLHVCIGSPALLTASGSGTLSWFSTAAGNTFLISGPSYQTPPLSAGVYTYYAEANTCTTSSVRTAVTVTATVCTNLESSSPSSFLQVHPNPSEGVIYVNTEWVSSRSRLCVYTATGALVLSQATNGQSTEINLEKAAKGIYFVTLTEGEKVIAVTKVVKQ